MAGFGRPRAAALLLLLLTLFSLLGSAGAQCRWDCNQGGSLSGSTCTLVYAADVTTDWNCPAGFRLNSNNQCVDDRCSGTFGKTADGVWACFDSAFIANAPLKWCSQLGRYCHTCKTSQGGPGGFWCDVNGVGSSFKCFAKKGTPINCGGDWVAGGTCVVSPTKSTSYACPVGGNHVAGTNNCRKTYQALGISCSSSTTPRPSVTSSITATRTRTSSESPTHSRTASQTRTATVSRSWTATSTVSTSFSSTATATVSTSLSVTRTGTQSPSNTVSRSHSATVSRSLSASISLTPTASVSFGTSPSITPSSNATPSSSITESATKSISVSRTNTRTGSTSPSISFSGSTTASATDSATATVTRGVSQSRSASYTTSGTRSPSFTVTSSISLPTTPSNTPTSTITGSRTGSTSPTTSKTGTRSRTGTPTVSISSSATLSRGASPPAPSLSGTSSATATASETASETRSFSSSITETGTATATISDSPSESFSATETASNSATESQTPTYSITQSVPPSLSLSPTVTRSGTASRSLGAAVRPAIINGLGSDDDDQAAGGGGGENAPGAPGSRGGGGGGAGDGGSGDGANGGGKVAGMDWWLLLIILLGILFLLLCCCLMALLYYRKRTKEQLARKKRALALAKKTGVSTLNKQPHSHLRINLRENDGVGKHQNYHTRLGRVSRLSMSPTQARGGRDGRDGDDNLPIKLLNKNKGPAGNKVNALLKGNGIELNSMVAHRLMEGNDGGDVDAFSPNDKAKVTRLADATIDFSTDGFGRSRSGRNARGSARAEFEPMAKALGGNKGRSYSQGGNEEEADDENGGEEGDAGDQGQGSTSQRSANMRGKKSRQEFSPQTSAAPRSREGAGWVGDEEDEDGNDSSGSGSGSSGSGLRSGSNRKRLQLDDDDDFRSGPSLARSAIAGRGSTRFGAIPSRNARRQNSSVDENAPESVSMEGGGESYEGSYASRLRTGSVAPTGSAGRVDSLRTQSGSVEGISGATRGRGTHASSFGFANPLSASEMDATSLQAANTKLGNLSLGGASTRINIASLFNFIGSPAARPGASGSHVDSNRSPSGSGYGSPALHPILTPSDYREFSAQREDISSPRYGRGQHHRDSIGASLGLDDSEVLPAAALGVEEGNNGARSSSIIRALGLSSGSIPASARPSASASMVGSGSAVTNQIYSRGSAVSVSSRMRPSLFRVSNPISAASRHSSTRDLGMSSEAGHNGAGEEDVSRLQQGGSSLRVTAAMSRMLGGLLGGGGRALTTIPKDGSLADGGLVDGGDGGGGGGDDADGGRSRSARADGVRRGSETNHGGPGSAYASRSLAGASRDESGRLALSAQRPRGYRGASSKKALAEHLGASSSVRAMAMVKGARSGSVAASSSSAAISAPPVVAVGKSPETSQ